MPANNATLILHIIAVSNTYDFETSRRIELIDIPNWFYSIFFGFGFYFDTAQARFYFANKSETFLKSFKEDLNLCQMWHFVRFGRFLLFTNSLPVVRKTF